MLQEDTCGAAFTAHIVRVISETRSNECLKIHIHVCNIHSYILQAGKANKMSNDLVNLREMVYDWNIFAILYEQQNMVWQKVVFIKTFLTKKQ